MASFNSSNHSQQPAPIPGQYRRACRTLRAYIKDRVAHPWLEQYWAKCVQVDSMSRDQLLELQQQRLQALLHVVLQQVPYYRQWSRREGIAAGDTVALEQLPIVSKRDYLAQPDLFISDAIDPSTLRSHQTSGSSGEPLSVRNDTATRDYSYCCLRRALLRHGIRPGDRLVHIWGRGRPRFNSRMKTLLYDAAMRGRRWMDSTLAVSAYDLSEATLESTLHRIERFDPHYMHGYVSALYALAMYLAKHDRTLDAPNLRLVVNDSEPFHEYQRELMQRVFRCRVVEHYGCLEVGNIAQENPQGYLCINEDYLIVEQSPQGEAIVTHLLAHAMPFIRYRIGDLIQINEQLTPGLPYRNLLSIEGRTADLLPVARGGHVHGLAIATAVYSGRPEVRQYQIRQRQIDHFEITVASEAPLSAQVVEQIITKVRQLTGDTTKVDIHRVEHIPPDHSGKFKLIVSDVKLHQPSQVQGNRASAGNEPPMSDS